MIRASLAALLLVAGVALAQPVPVPGLPPDVPAQQAEELLRSERFRALASELRCLVCQNQTLADSGADLAVDLRNEVLRQMAAGRDDRQIKDHLVARYGEFVLYRPTLSARNLALWFGPAVLLAIGATVLWRVARHRPAGAGPAPARDDERVARIERMLADEPPADRGPRT